MSKYVGVISKSNQAALGRHINGYILLLMHETSIQSLIKFLSTRYTFIRFISEENQSGLSHVNYWEGVNMRFYY